MDVNVDALLMLLNSQAGDRYIFGVEVSPSDTNPDAFDCSELVEWGCRHLRVDPTMPDGSWYQYRHVHRHGLTVPIGQAIATRGALLFRFAGGNPLVGRRPPSAHVAVSRGDGTTIEARSSRYGVGHFSAYLRGWTHAGLIPGIDYHPTREENTVRIVRGDVGPFVGPYQEAVNVAHQINGIPGEPLAIDDVFGPLTEQAVSRYQRAAGLEGKTGIVLGQLDDLTRDLLDRYMRKAG